MLPKVVQTLDQTIVAHYFHISCVYKQKCLSKEDYVSTYLMIANRSCHGDISKINKSFPMSTLQTFFSFWMAHTTVNLQRCFTCFTV